MKRNIIVLEWAQRDISNSKIAIVYTVRYSNGLSARNKTKAPEVW